MAFYEVLENLDGVEEAERGNYEATKDGYRREIEVPDVSKLKTALQSERDTARTLAEKLELYKDIDPDKYAEILREKEEAERAAMSEKERYESDLLKKVDEIEDLKKTSAARMRDLEGQLSTFHLDDKSAKAALSAGVIPEDMEDVLLLTRKNRSLNDKGEIVVLDDKGNETGQTLKEFFEKDFKEKKPKFYAGIPGGGGTPPGGGGASVQADWLKLSPVERLNQARAAKR